MRRDSRLSVALHVLLHMSDIDHPITSDALGPLMKANPVVLRRTMAGLRDAGIVRSEKGHGGGWSLARELGTVTLGDVYAALGVTPFHIGNRDPKPTCLLEKAANLAVSAALEDAEALLVARLRSVTVADVLRTAREETREGAARRGNSGRARAEAPEGKGRHDARRHHHRG